MSPPIGFTLVTYQNPAQILFLCQRLDVLFHGAPIALHHDFAQCALDRSQFPPNVRFVEAWRRTEWGSLTVVDAVLDCLRLLYASREGWGDPDWVITLSSADYPIQTAETILDELASTPVDAFLDSRVIHRYPGPFRNEPLGEFPFQQPRFHQFAFNRYVAIPTLPQKLARRLKVPVEKYCLHSAWLTTRRTPFRGSIRCYAGDPWMTVRRSVAKLFLDETPFWRMLHRHYSRRSVPEESFCHTLLGNTPGFQVSPHSRRFTDWKGCFAHPRTLGRADIPALLASKDHFARKFPFDPQVFAELEQAVANKAATGAALAVR